MGYRIVYSRKNRRNKAKILLLCVWIALVVCCLQDVSVATALDAMADQLQNGENAAQAVTAFCQEMIYGT